MANASINGKIVNGFSLSGSLVNGIAVDGVAIWTKSTGLPAGSLGLKNIGDVVKLNVNAVQTEFIVAHKGLPSSMYVGFDNTVILVQKDLKDTKAMATANNNNYSASDMHVYLNGDYLNSIEAGVRSKIVDVKIPYRTGVTGWTINSGVNCLLCKVFNITGAEVGFPSTESYMPMDGSKFDYFLTGNAASGDGLLARQQRIAYRAGVEALYWLRTPNTANQYTYHYVTAAGAYLNASSNVGNLYAPRPVFALPETVKTDSNGVII